MQISIRKSNHVTPIMNPMGESNEPIVFIVRSALRDGLGHLVRSLAVLHELRPLHPVRLLLLGDGSGRHLLESGDIKCITCSSDTEAAARALKMSARMIVFDTLHFEQEAFAALPGGVPTISLSPVFSRMADVDHLFHRTCKGDPSWPSEGKFPKVHLGLHYSVLPRWLKRTSTSTYHELLCEDKLGVAISMGGTDAPNRTLTLLKLFGQCRASLVLFVALGDAYTHSYAQLLEVAEANRQEVILLKSNESMWRVLKRAVSLIVCAGGLTTYEAAFVGLPTINILQTANWAYLFEELAESGACRVLPHGETSLVAAVEMVEELAMQRRDDLATMHMATKGLIPEGGASRIATKMHSILSLHESRSPAFF